MSEEPNKKNIQNSRPFNITYLITVIVTFSIIVILLFSYQEEKESDISYSHKVLFFEPMENITCILTSDLDCDGQGEIITGIYQEKIIVFSHSGEILWEYSDVKPLRNIFIGHFYSKEYRNIAFISGGISGVRLNMLEPNGSLIWEGKKFTGDIMRYSIKDIDNDGLDEIVTYGRAWPDEGRVKAWDGNGTLLWTFNTEKSPGGSESIKIADLDSDGEMEIIIGTWIQQNDSLIVLDSFGNKIWSVYIVGGMYSDHSQGISSIQTFDFNKDGKMEIFIGSSDLTLFDYEGNIIWTEKNKGVNSMCKGDFNGDGKIELVGIGGGKIYFFDENGIKDYFWREPAGRSPGGTIFAKKVINDKKDDIVVLTNHFGSEDNSSEIISYKSNGEVNFIIEDIEYLAFVDYDDDNVDEIIYAKVINDCGLYIAKIERG